MVRVRVPAQTSILRAFSAIKRSSSPRFFCTLAILALMAALPAASQTTGAATLVGTVRDSTSAIVPGAKVVVVNIQTSFRSETVTSAEGSYYVPYLNPGTYRITVEAAGFKQYVRDGVVLRPGERPRVDVQLDIGAVSEAVTVSASAPLLNTESAITGAALGQEVLRNVANVQKRIVRTLYYMPGVVGAGDTGYHMLGSIQRAIGYSLDGIGGKWPGLGTFDQNDQVIQTTQDALEEVKVVTSGMSAEFGHAAGGGIQLTYRSGTNDLHGSLEDRFLRTPLVHRHYLQQTDQQPFRYDTLEGVFSGPVVLPKLYDGKNKTFFLFGFAAHLESWSWEARTNVPNQAMLNGDFSFGGIGLPIYDPAAMRQENGKWVSDPFAGNIIPKNRFDNVAKNFLALNPWAEPNTDGYLTKDGPQENLVANGLKPIKRIRWDVKIDHQFNSNHKVFGRYSHARHRAARNNYNPQIAFEDLDVNRQPQPIDLVNGVVNYTTVLGPARFNEVRIGFNRRRYTGESTTYGQDWAGKLGIPGVSADTFPYFNIGYGLASTTREYYAGEEVTVQNNFTQIMGSHTLKTGGEIMRSRYNQAAAVLPSGQYNFGGTNMPFTPNTGNTFASFLLGSVSNATFSQRFANWLPRWSMYALYLQDDWRVRQGMTLSLGLRWSYETPFHTKYDQQSQFDPTAKDPLSGLMGALIHPTGYLHKSDKNNFQPRFGLVWNFQPKWVFRSSFSVLTQDIGTLSANQNFQDYNGSINRAMPTGDPRPAFQLSNGPGALSYPLQADGTVPWVGGNYSSRTATWLDPNLRNPYILNWTAGLQYEFAGNWLMEMRYEGSSGVRLLGNWNINEIPLAITLGGDRVLQDKVYQAQQNYKPYTNFGSINLISNFNHTSYHGGTLRVEKRFANGFSLNAFHTYAKALGETDGEGGGGITYYNRSLQKGRAGYDIRHHFNLMATYELPFGQGRRFLNRSGVLNHVLGGWEFSWSQTFDTGRPFSVGFSNSPYKYLTGTRPVLLTTVEDAVAKDWDIGPNRFPFAAQNPYMKFDAFAYPEAYTTGTLGRNVFEGPGLNVQAFALNKTWTFKERVRATVRLDAHNLPFKHPSFNLPNSTYNRNAPTQFGTFSGTRGSWSEYGNSQATFQLGGRVEF